MKIPSKFKYIEIKPIYVVIVVILAVAIRFWGENSITMLQKKVPEINTTDVSAAEIYRYITTKKSYIDENMHIDWNLAQDSSFEKTLDKDTHEWFLVRKWRPSRFVYVQNRIKQILTYLHNREQNLGEAERMKELAKQYEEILKKNPEEKQAAQFAAEMKRKARDIYYYKDREIRHAGITNEEQDIVLKNRNGLEEIIDE